MITSNIKTGYLILTNAEGLSFKFKSTTDIANTTSSEMAGIKQMQGGKAIYYSINNQQVDSADFTLKPITKEEFNVVKELWESKAKFNLAFSHNDGIITYENPIVKKQPMFEAINEGEDTFAVKLYILCESIDIKLAD